MNTAYFTSRAADESLIEDFNQIATTTLSGGEAKYSKKVQEQLAKFIVGCGGIKKDTLLFELSHLILVLFWLKHHQHDLFEQLQVDNIEFVLLYNNFATIKSILRQFPMDTNELIVADDKLVVFPGDNSADKKEFIIYFKRIPALMAVFEFLFSIDKLEKKQTQIETNGIFGSQLQLLIQQHINRFCSSKIIRTLFVKPIALQMRLYREKYLNYYKYESQFNSLVSFCKNFHHDKNNNITINDESILHFWLENSNQKDSYYRKFETVFYYFIKISEKIRNTQVCFSLRNSLLIDDMENRIDATENAEDGNESADNNDTNKNESDGNSAHTDYYHTSWQSAISQLKQQPLASVKFISKEKIQQHAFILEHGYNCIDFTVSLFRVAVFAPIQSAIANHIRFKHNKDTIERSISCQNTLQYRELEAIYEEMIQYLKDTSLASYYILKQKELVEEDKEYESKAAKAYSKINRKGFNPKPDFSEDEILAHIKVLPLLSELISLFKKHKKKISILNKEDGALKLLLKQDKEIFSTQFSKLYQQQLKNET